MNQSYRIFFELQREPFRADIAHREILKTPVVQGIRKTDSLCRQSWGNRPDHRRNRQRKVNGIEVCVR